MKSSTVIHEAKTIAGLNWSALPDESGATKEAVNITKLWQEKLIGMDSDRFKKEVAIGKDLKEKIDLVDFQEKTAYELKVSGKNSGHEFYKDLFKVLVYNQNRTIKLEKLVFITESSGITELENGLGKVAAELLKKSKVEVELVRLD